MAISEYWFESSGPLHATALTSHDSGPTNARGTFLSSGVAVIKVKITAYHAGWFEFRLAVPSDGGADKTVPITQTLLNQHVLEVVSYEPKGERTYLAGRRQRNSSSGTRKGFLDPGLPSSAQLQGHEGDVKERGRRMVSLHKRAAGYAGDRDEHMFSHLVYTYVTHHTCSGTSAKTLAATTTPPRRRLSNFGHMVRVRGARGNPSGDTK